MNLNELIGLMTDKRVLRIHTVLEGGVETEVELHPSAFSPSPDSSIDKPLAETLFLNDAGAKLCSCGHNEDEHTPGIGCLRGCMRCEALEEKL